MAKRRKLKKAVDAALSKKSVVHDRRAMDIPINAQVAVTRERDAYGDPDGAQWDAKRGEWRVPDHEAANLIVSLRDDPLRQLLVRGNISRLQYDGGRWYEARLEAQLGSVRAIDPAKEAVDGGKLPEAITESFQRAMADIGRANKALGIEGQRICRGILGQGLTITQFAVSRGLGSRAEIEYVGRRFRECLTTLAGIAGLITDAAPRSRSVSRETLSSGSIGGHKY